ncbi:MAG TPA: DNA-binding domain-containing protein [Micropepsaceae bacterium]|jgi:hypothetical protein
MPTLRETQHALLNALAFGNSEHAASQIAGGGFSPDERLDIYRNTYLSALTSALRISYPAVHRLVGAAFFEGAAQSFVETHPPRSAYLNVYGVEFAEFLAQFPPAQSLPYLGDVARLEWAVNVALHAKDAAPMDPHIFARLGEIAPERLILVPHPAVTLLRTDHAVRALWQAVLAEDDCALDAVDWAAGPEWLLVERTAAGIEVLCLPEREWRFTAALCAGESFATAVEAAPGADVTTLFARHLATGCFTDFRRAGAYPLAPSETIP